MTIDENLRDKFEAAVDQFADSMYRVAFRLTGNRELASELVQESYYQAWRSLGSLKDIQKMRSWMFAILRNQYTKQLRSESGWQSMTQGLADRFLGSADGSSEDNLRDTVQMAIERLGDEHKLPILMVSMEGFSVNEAAEALNIPRGTVLSRLHRGREKLKQMLSDQIAGLPSNATSQDETQSR